MRTSVCDMLTIEHPIAQAGMARVYTNAELVAAVSNAGGLAGVGAGRIGELKPAGQVVHDIIAEDIRVLRKQSSSQALM
jgi:NAD(P)H-dependent flavin oxidoreductase YrpB (nitropropane dioxygenase family)